MKLIEVIIFVTILLLFLSSAGKVSIQITEYKKGSLLYMNKTQEVLQEYASFMIQKEGELDET